MKFLIASKEYGSIHGDPWTNQDVSTFRFGSEGRSSYIQKMIVIELHGKHYGGVIQTYDSENYQLVREFKAVTKDICDSIIGLDCIEGKLWSCSVEGKIMIADLTKDDDGSCKFCYMSGIPLSIFRMHPTQPGVAAVGGRSIGPKIIKVLSTSQYESSTVIDNANFVERTLEGSDYRVWRVWDSEGKVGDSFSYSAQVWVSDLAFWDVEIPSSQGWRLATATRYGQIHIYNTTAGSKPIFVIPVSDHPLTNIRLNQEGSQLFFVDTQDIIGKVDPFLGILIEKYRISAGSAWYIDTFDSFIDMQEQNDNHVRDDNGMSNLNNNSNKSVIVTGGLDRYLRIYDYRKELQLKRKVYIGCTVTAVIVLDGNDSQERELQEHASALTRSRVCMDEEDNQKS